jgi:hypothetical protein
MNERETWRRAIAEQRCPLCGAGPFQSIAQHTSAKHDITQDDIREFAHLPKQASICSPEFSERHSEQAKGRKMPPAKPGRTYTRNSYGVEMSRKGASDRQRRARTSRAADLERLTKCRDPGRGSEGGAVHL